jgi:hypothetical protein
MVYLASTFLLLAALVALGNIGGAASATKERGYSAIPFLSLIFCTVAFFLARETLGAWAFLPTLFDPGTWVVAVLPAYLTYHFIVDRRKLDALQKESSDAE